MFNGIAHIIIKHHMTDFNINPKFHCVDLRNTRSYRNTHIWGIFTFSWLGWKCNRALYIMYSTNRATEQSQGSFGTKTLELSARLMWCREPQYLHTVHNFTNAIKYQFFKSDFDPYHHFLHFFPNLHAVFLFFIWCQSLSGLSLLPPTCPPTILCSSIQQSKLPGILPLPCGGHCM